MGAYALFMDQSTIKKIIEELFESGSFDLAGVEVDHDEDVGIMRFKIDTKDSRFFLAAGGEPLFALNAVLRRIIEGKTPEGQTNPTSFILDINDVQKKRIDSLKTIAHMMSERAKFFKASVNLDPMPAHDRRIVHEFLSKKSDLMTESAGVGHDRHIVIKYVGTEI